MSKPLKQDERAELEHLRAQQQRRQQQCAEAGRIGGGRKTLAKTAALAQARQQRATLYVALYVPAVSPYQGLPQQGRPLWISLSELRRLQYAQGWRQARAKNNGYSFRQANSHHGGVGWGRKLLLTDKEVQKLQAARPQRDALLKGRT
jgi:hypothetical protein